MVIIVKWHKKPPASPFYNRKFAVTFVVLLIFVVYVVNLGKRLSAENQDMGITDGSNVEKFR